MLGTGITLSSALRHAPVAQVDRTQVDVFSSLYEVFLVLGTLVGVVVISYTVYNAYKYRTSDGDADGRYDIEGDGPDDGDDVARPRRGEIPTGQGKGGGKKLFMSFSISAVLVLGLIIYSYSLLLYVEDTSSDDTDALEVNVEGYTFGWAYQYEGGNGTVNSSDDTYEQAVVNISEEVGDLEYDNQSGDFVYDDETFGADQILVAPAGHQVNLEVTSRDTFHNYGIPELRAKTDAIPDQYTTTWFQADEPGVYEAKCFELCGQGHSNMKGPVVVVEPDAFVDAFDGLEEMEDSDLEPIGETA